MLKAKRQQILLETLERENEIAIGELSRLLGATPMTLHRDLQELEAKNALKRVYGGAVSLTAEKRQPTYHQRKTTERMKKLAIANEALKFIRNGQVVFFDAGTTTLELARLIPDEVSIHAVTTGLHTAAALAEKPGVQVLQLGGDLHKSSFSTMGSDVINRLEGLHADIAFVSTKTLHEDFGTYEAVTGLIEIKRALAKSSDKVVLLVDSTKLGKKSLSQALPLESIDVIITDDAAPESERKKYIDKMIIAQ